MRRRNQRNATSYNIAWRWWISLLFVNRSDVEQITLQLSLESLRRAAARINHQRLTQ